LKTFDEAADAFDQYLKIAEGAGYRQIELWRNSELMARWPDGPE
jgi:hypothetical protein